MIHVKHPMYSLYKVSTLKFSQKIQKVTVSPTRYFHLNICSCTNVFYNHQNLNLESKTSTELKNVAQNKRLLSSGNIELNTDNLECNKSNLVNDDIHKSEVNSGDNKNILRKRKFEGPELKDFLSSQNGIIDDKIEKIPYLQSFNGNGQKVYLEIYGCQMNVSDAEIISAILKKHNYELSNSMSGTDIVLLVTCAIRDGAEQKVWYKLQMLKALKQKKRIAKIGLLGCMAERLKHKIIEQEKIVDIIAGPDSYKDLPRLLAVSNDHETAINVALSFDETYADVTPVRLDQNSKSAYVTIMRGCDNMCTYCIVPFTRGKERSRPIASILDEIRQLSDQGVKEVTLLGQNVNSYRDLSEYSSYKNATPTKLVDGFKTVYKNKSGGLRFADLLDKVSLINPEMRIRFTSPHPKDFPDEVLHLISERPNICEQLHLPAQSGNTNVLTRMRRGYSREAYLNLVDHVRSILPNVALSSDFIAGFCDETEEEFNETLSLIETVGYNYAYLFAYSMREKTTAHRRYIDNVDQKVKIERLQKMIKLYRTTAEKLNQNQIGQQQLVLVEGESKRSLNDWQGRNDGNIRVIFPYKSVPESDASSSCKPIKSGDYVVVQICQANSQVLKGIPLYHSSITEFSSRQDDKKYVYNCST